MNNPSQSLKSTLLVPTLNEIEAVKVIMPQVEKSWIDEILVVDGGSTDGTIEYFQDLGIRIHPQSKRGFGEAMKQGVSIAEGEIIVEFTPDGNSIPSAIPRLVSKIKEGNDLVIASRYKNGAKSEDDDWLTAIGNKLFTGIVNLLFRSSYTDVLVGYRAYRRSSFKQLKMDAAGLSWPCQSTIQFFRKNFRVAEIGADEPKRIGGVRKMRPFKTGWEVLTLIIREFFRKL